MITHPHEVFFFYRIKQGSVVEGILSTCEEFYQLYGCMPDGIAVNARLTLAFIREIRMNPTKQILCIPNEDILWMYVPPWHAKMMPHAQWVVVTNSRLPGVACSL